MTSLALTPAQLRGDERRSRIARFARFARQLARRPSAATGLMIIAVFAAFGAFPDLFVGRMETVLTPSGVPLQGPGVVHILGTDQIGRDIFNLVVHGARISLMIGVAATFMAVFIGTTIGMASGLIGGTFDMVLMRIVDAFMVIPVFLLALVLAPVIIELVGQSGTFLGFRITFFVIIFVIGIGGWAGMARIVRSQTLSLRERAFVDRARAIGSGPRHIMAHHILPNVMPMVVANTVLGISGAIMSETGLSFIGLGDPFQPSWGMILSSAQTSGAATNGAWWYLAAPGLCIVLVMLSCTLAGNALDEVLNPRLAGRR